MSASTALRSYLRNKEWIESHYERLSAEYNRKYVAVVRERVIAVGDTVPELKVAMVKNSLFGDPGEAAIVYVTADSSAMLL